MTSELEQAAELLIDWALKENPPGVSQSQLNAVSQHCKTLFKRLLEKRGLEQDGRQTSYSVRYVLHRQDTDDIEGVSPWMHGVRGLSAVWDYIEAEGGAIAEYLGVKGCPVPLTANELVAREPTARVSMSRKKNGVAAIRVPFATMTGGARLSPDAPGKPENWVLRIDVGTEDAGRTLDRQERDAASPLVVEE